jgi:hypothetical protein
MFADSALAARIDRSEADLCARLATLSTEPGPFVLPIAGGQAVFISRGSPMNKVIGLGFDQPLDLAQLEEVERRWSTVGEPVRIELSILTDPEVVRTLTQRGYSVHGFENVLGHSLQDISAGKPDGIRIAIAEDEAAMRSWLDIGVEAFTNLDGTGSVADAVERAELEKALLDMTRAPGFLRYVAWVGDEAVGSAGMRIDGDLAQVAGAGTRVAFRGRGVQKALLQRRLGDARAAGCTLAVVTTSPGTRSQDNVMRRGFSLLYTRAILIRPLI